MVEIKYHPECDAAFRRIHHDELDQWLHTFGNAQTQAADGAMVEFDQAYVLYVHGSLFKIYGVPTSLIFEHSNGMTMRLCILLSA